MLVLFLRLISGRFKADHGIGYCETSASLVIERTVSAIALAIFLVAGFVVMLMAGSLPPTYRAAAGIGLGLLSVGILGFFLVQRYKLFSRAGGWFGRKRAGRVMSFFDTGQTREDAVRSAGATPIECGVPARGNGGNIRETADCTEIEPAPNMVPPPAIGDQVRSVDRTGS